MSDPQTATDVSRLLELSREKEQISEELLTLLEEWEAISEAEG